MQNDTAHEKFSSFELENIKTQIEKLDKMHHIEILKMLKKNNSVKLNENKSGVFVNLSFLPKSLIDEIVKYVQFVSVQENDISTLEKQQENCKTLLV